jgi:thioredoxin reductase (NADPH)
MDALNLDAVAYPKLTEAQMAAFGRCNSATPKRYRNGERLFQAGDRDFGFFVVKSGKVEILDESGDVPKSLTVHAPGNFTGEIAHLTGGPALVSAVARGDTEVYEINADGVRQIINLVPELGDTILQAFIARRQLLRESGNFTGIRVIGSRYSSDTFRVREFLAKNRLPFTWLDLESDPDVTQVLKQFGVSEADTPVVMWGRKLILRNPSDRELAEALGIRRPLEHTTYDLIIVGAGPAGLGAAVYAASEGLNTIVLESAGPGGQAGRSMRIENYLGFPTGISGSELAERAAVQASKFGARIAVPTPVTHLTFEACIRRCTSTEARH